MNELDLCIHIQDYDKYVTYIKDLEDRIESFQKRIERSILEEELLFSFKYATFENWDKSMSKLMRMSFFWRKTKEFYDEKKKILTYFNEQTELEGIYNYIDRIKEEIVLIREKEELASEDVLFRVSKFVKDDILSFIEFLKIMIIIYNDYDKEKFNEVTKRIEEIKGKNIDPAIKMILQKVYHEEYYSYL